VDVDPPVVAPKRGQVVVRIGDVVASAAIPDFEIDDVTTATVDEMVPIRFGKPATIPGPSTFSPASVTKVASPSSTITNSSSSECQWRSAEAVPGGRRVRFTPNDVSPSGSPSARFSRGKGAAQMLGIGRAAARLNRRRVENRKWSGI